MKNFWFYLEPYTFLFNKEKEILIYNSLSHNYKKIENKGKLKRIVNELTNPNNMYCVELTENEIKDSDINNFISYVIQTFSGDLIEATDSYAKPAVLVPVLNLEQDVEKLRNEENRSIGESLKTYLSEIILYIGGGKSNSSLLKIPVHKQFEYSKKNDNIQLSISSILEFISKIEGSGTKTIKILGGNIFDYENIELLSETLNTISADKIYMNHYKDIPDYIGDFQFFKEEKNFLKVLVDFPVDVKQLKNLVENLSKSAINVSWLFAITSLEEYLTSEEIILELQLNDYEIKPVFTTENITFFEENVFLNDQDLENSKLSRRDIFLQQVLNCNDFGKITIMEDGKVYGNVNQPSLGTYKDSILDILYNEFDKGTSWRRIRNQHPCVDCINQWICPSPSNYELIIGKTNLCHYKFN